MDLPNDDAIRWIVRTYASLRARHGKAIGSPALVQPTGDFFPDEFCVDGPSVQRLLRRIISYAPLADDLDIQLGFADPSENQAGGCGSAACGPGGSPKGGARRMVDELPDGYRVVVAANDVPNPDLLTTALVRAVGSLVLYEAGEDIENGADEIAAVACGFGVLLAGGAAVWAKSCGGLRMAQATALSVEELTVALALFLAVHDIKANDARAHMGATQREALDVAVAWTESNPLLIEALRDRPATLESGAIDVEPVRGLIGRWMHKRKLDRELRTPVVKAQTPLSEDKRRRLEEARALVDEVLDEQRGS